MPSENQSKGLTEEQKQKVVDWMAEHWESDGLICPACKNDTWTASDHFVAPVVFTAEGRFVMGGASYPHVLLVCTKCGCTMFFNAVRMGLLEGTEEVEGAEKKEQEKKAEGGRDG